MVPTRQSWCYLKTAHRLLCRTACMQQCERKGGGRYSHWGEMLLFSASDSTDPRTNGRTYEARINYGPAKSLIWLALGAGLLLTFLLINSVAKNCSTANWRQALTAEKRGRITSAAAV